MLNLIKKISLTNELLTITEMLSVIQMQNITKTLNKRMVHDGKIIGMDKIN